MRTARTLTVKQAAAIRVLLARCLRVGRDEQKVIRGELRNTHRFWILDFERGLTPRGFDSLFESGTLTLEPGT